MQEEAWAFAISAGLTASVVLSQLYMVPAASAAEPAAMAGRFVTSLAVAPDAVPSTQFASSICTVDENSPCGSRGAHVVIGDASFPGKDYWLELGPGCYSTGGGRRCDERRSLLCECGQ